MTRREERELALSMLFEWGFDPARTAQEIYETAAISRDAEESSYARKLLSGVIEKKESLDAMIEEHLKGWKRNRISRVSMAIIYMAAYELAYLEDVPARVSLNEAIELAKLYDTDNAYAFVNGVLNALATACGKKDQ